MVQETPHPLTFEQLRSAVAGPAAAIRAVTRLGPAGGNGDKLFPPTYEGGRYAFEERLINGQRIPAVLLDSVASHPVTCEKEYTAEEWEFMKAMDRYKKSKQRPYPT